ncbi:hypothetical protein DFH08DRAFT_986971 [Mycena albidolilacea]|uniref:Uncharacterized protein n=1 Tax=Mycena albidolilacea TaxID=1033008 RepID=A0AAD6Z0R0_9AGAR|nr:hypothetical protein DFH08DRAFT_986971 [Mycena albidolilacea]
MGRWTQYNEDSTRLPVGMQRIGYDADTARYTFSDEEGNIYTGPAHEEYGVLSLVRSSSADDVERPHAFASDAEDVPAQANGSPSTSTFHDLLPPHLIASPSPTSSRSTPTSESSSRLRTAVRRSALPALQNAVNTVRRSATSISGRNSKSSRARDDEKDALIS